MLGDACAGAVGAALANVTTSATTATSAFDENILLEEFLNRVKRRQNAKRESLETGCIEEVCGQLMGACLLGLPVLLQRVPWHGEGGFICLGTE